MSSLIEQRISERLPRHEVERRWRELAQRLQAIADKTGGDTLIVSASLLEEAKFLASEMAKPNEEPPSYTCPRCGMKSYHRIDIKHRYCGNCHQFEDDNDRAS